jgi:hypothetical protein
MKIKFTETGDGQEIPAVDCQCELCERTKKEGGKNHWRRISVILRNGTETILYNTPPSLEEMLNEECVFKISSIILSPYGQKTRLAVSLGFTSTPQQSPPTCLSPPRSPLIDKLFRPYSPMFFQESSIPC